MTVRDIVRILQADVISGVDKLEREVTCIGASDMMSDVLAYCKPGMVVISSQTTPQSIRTGLVTDILGMVIVQNKSIPSQTIKMAQEHNFLLLKSKFFKFTACGRLYMAGFKGLDGE